MRKKILAILVTPLVALGLVLAAAPAAMSSVDAEWTANNHSAITGVNEVRLVGGATSVEHLNLGESVTVDTEIRFEYKLDATATCTAGAPRVFVFVNGVNTNSWDRLLSTNAQCGTDGPWHAVTFKSEQAGTIGHAGIVWDNGQTGAIWVRNLKIGDKLIQFRSPVAPPTTEPTAPITPTPEPTPSSTPSPEPTPSATPTPDGGNGGGDPTPTDDVPTPAPTTNPGGELALTGQDTNGRNVALIAALVGFLMVCVGGAGIAWSRIRKVEAE